MEKKYIEKEYKKLVDSIENLRMYDGRGTVDRMKTIIDIMDCLYSKQQL